MIYVKILFGLLEFFLGALHVFVVVDVLATGLLGDGTRVLLLELRLLRLVHLMRRHKVLLHGLLLLGIARLLGRLLRLILRLRWLVCRLLRLVRGLLIRILSSIHRGNLTSTVC